MTSKTKGIELSKENLLLRRAMFLIWNGFLVYFIFKAIADKATPLLLGGCLMMVFGLFVWRYERRLADEVYDCGDYLLVRQRGIEERVPLSNVANIDVSDLAHVGSGDSGAPVIKIRLIKPGKLGERIRFRLSMNWLGELPTMSALEDLTARIQSARRFGHRADVVSR